MEIIITQWALNAYLNLVLHQQLITKNEFSSEIKPDVLMLKRFPNEPRFSSGLFWSIARVTKGSPPIPNGYKMKWHQIGAGRVQLRLPIGILEDAYLCSAYIKQNKKQEQRELAKFKTYLQLIRQNKYNECGKLS